jgi:hypothetical protein
MSEVFWYRAAPLALILFATGLIVMAGTLAIGALLAIGLVALIAVRPAVGGYLYLGVTPLVAGINRDVFLPVLRIHEALLALIIGALLLRGLMRMIMGHRYSLRLSRLDMAMAALAVTGSLVATLWRFSQGEPITSDDVFYAAVFWKYLALYVVFRVAVRTPNEAKTSLWIALFATSIVGILAILQALGLFGVPELLFALYPPFLGETPDVGRGASTLALTFAVADVSLICAAAALALLRQATGPKRQLLIGLVALYLLSAFAAGQFSGFIGIVVAAIALGGAFGEMRRVFRYSIPASIIGGLIVSPVIAERLAGFQTGNGLPQSWNGRLDNLTHFILPEFSNGWNLLFGVRPAARVPAPETWREWVFIESGYVWLLWSGGIPLLIAFCYFIVICSRTLRVTMASHTAEVKAIATGAFVGIWVIAVLTIFDPHLTMRGVADLLFPLLAMAQVAHFARDARAPRSHDSRQVEVAV